MTNVARLRKIVEKAIEKERIMPTSELKKKRDELLRDVKKEKSEEYKTAYFDGALDMYNVAVKIKEIKGGKSDSIVDG